LQLNKLAFILLANTTSNVFRCFYFGVVFDWSLHYTGSLVIIIIQIVNSF